MSDAIKDKVKKKKPSVIIDDKPKEEAEKVVDSNGKKYWKLGLEWFI